MLVLNRASPYTQQVSRRQFLHSRAPIDRLSRWSAKITGSDLVTSLVRRVGCYIPSRPSMSIGKAGLCGSAQAAPDPRRVGDTEVYASSRSRNRPAARTTCTRHCSYRNNDNIARASAKTYTRLHSGLSLHAAPVSIARFSAVVHNRRINTVFQNEGVDDGATVHTSPAFIVEVPPAHIFRNQ